MYPRDFTALVQGTWIHWMGTLEKIKEIDCEETQQSLSIILPDGRVYLFNIHSGMRQLWMSSPVSGGHHFVFSQGNRDEETALGDTLNALVPSLSMEKQEGVTLEKEGCGQNFYWCNTRTHEAVEDILNREFLEKYGISLNLTPVDFSKA